MNFGTTVAGFLFALMWLCALVLSFVINQIVRRRGYATSWWYGQIRDIRFFRKIIAQERDPETRLHYRKILYGYYIAMGLGVFICLLSLLVQD
jgi:amino acid permease